MFRAISCSSSGGQIVLTQHLVSSLSVSDRPVHGLRKNCRVVRFTLRPLYRQEIPPISIEQKGWVGPRVSGRCADTISSPCRNSYPGSSIPVAQSPKHIYQIRTNNLLSQFPRVSMLIAVHPISNTLISVLPTRVMKIVVKLHLRPLLCPQC
jgi:hypothetical protein